MLKKNSFWILLFLGVSFFSCEYVGKKEIIKYPETLINKHKKNYTALIDSSKQFLADGHIILRTGNDAISGLFAELNKTDKTFSHCGVVFKENNNWYVYHSIGGEDNPDEKLRRESYESFVAQSHNEGFGICRYSLNEKQLNELNKIILQWYHEAKPFDMEFDLKTDNRLYCAEMLFKAFNYACKTDSFFHITNHKGFQYVSTDNIFVNKDAQMLCHIVY